MIFLPDTAYEIATSDGTVKSGDSRMLSRGLKRKSEYKPPTRKSSKGGNP